MHSWGAACAHQDEFNFGGFIASCVERMTNYAFVFVQKEYWICFGYVTATHRTGINETLVLAAHGMVSRPRVHDICGESKKDKKTEKVNLWYPWKKSWSVTWMIIYFCPISFFLATISHNNTVLISGSTEIWGSFIVGSLGARNMRVTQVSSEIPQVSHSFWRIRWWWRNSKRSRGKAWLCP